MPAAKKRKATAKTVAPATPTTPQRRPSAVTALRRILGFTKVLARSEKAFTAEKLRAKLANIRDYACDAEEAFDKDSDSRYYVVMEALTDSGFSRGSGTKEESTWAVDDSMTFEEWQAHHEAIAFALEEAKRTPDGDTPTTGTGKRVRFSETPETDNLRPRNSERARVTFHVP
jgi:hypothetical protein